jgi:hypothetical protein
MLIPLKYGFDFGNLFRTKDSEAGVKGCVRFSEGKRYQVN